MTHQVTSGVVALKHRKEHFWFAAEVFRYIQSILPSMEKPDLQVAHDALYSLDLDLKVYSEADAHTWAVWFELLARFDVDNDDSEIPYTMNLVHCDGICGTQSHQWIEVASLLFTERYIIDVAAPDVYSNPLLIGPRSPLVLAYSRAGERQTV